ncbi:unnamed protein product, partial [Didymodactylos carnosus]
LIGLIMALEQESMLKPEHEDNNNKAKNYNTHKSVFIYICVVCFGIGTWLDLNGVWIQIPLIVDKVPEGWEFSAYLGLMSNLANIGPLSVVLLRRSINKSTAYEVPANFSILTVGVVALLALSFLWDKSAYFLKQRRSIWMLVLCFWLAVVDCTSSVTFAPFMSRYQPLYLNGLFTGEGLSSLLPALLAIIQGVGGESKCVQQLVWNETTNQTVNITVKEPTSPRFTVRTYFLCITALMCLSFVSFIILVLTKTGKHKTPGSHTQKTNDHVSEKRQPNEQNGTTNQSLSNKNEDWKLDTQQPPHFWYSEHGLFLICIFWISFVLLGCIPSINTYSLYPYGIKTFHWTIILCQFTYPLLSLFVTVTPQMPPRGCYVLTAIGSLFSIYIFVTAVTSPCSPLVDKPIGKIIISTVWILVYLIFYYVRIVLGNHFRLLTGHRGLFWYGAFTQLGAFTGAILIYILVIATKVFREREVCVTYDCRF